jgi:hypothetical protein
MASSEAAASGPARKARKAKSAPDLTDPARFLAAPVIQ